MQSHRGQRWENAALEAANYPGDRPELLRLVSVGSLAGALVVVILIALIRRRVDLALRAGAVIALSSLTGQLLKYELLDRPPLSALTSDNTFPSGHAIAFTCVLAGLAIVLPPTLRSLLIVPATAVVAIAYIQLLAFGWHRLSDVLGALLLVFGVHTLVALAWPGPDRIERTGMLDRVSSRIFLAVGLLILIVAGIFTLLYIGDLLATNDTLLLTTQIAAVGALVTAVGIALLNPPTGRERRGTVGHVR